MLKNILIKIQSVKNPFILFFPFLIFYVLLIIIFSEKISIGDEHRYIIYANNLTNGFYSLPDPYLDLGNGPGYPILITPFVAMGLPLISIKLLNAFFYYFSVVFFFKALQQVVPIKFAIIFSIMWALYPTTFVSISYVLPEVFAASLIPLLIFSLLKSFKPKNTEDNKKYYLLAGLTFGYLALTKPIFGYVIIFMLLGIFVLWVIKYKSINLKRSMVVLTIAFLTTIPWLTYTYHMTGKMFYWSTYGGNNLYWMSTPYENEYGDWMVNPIIPQAKDKYRLPGFEEQVKLLHQQDFEKIFESKEAKDLYIKDGDIIGSPYTGVIQDNTLKRIAIQNIKSHPLKFIQNCISNAGRIIFNYPASYTIQKPSTLSRLPINGTIIVFSVLSFIFTILNWKKILFPFRFLLFFNLLYFGGSLLGSAEPRMFVLIVPYLLIWTSYILFKSIRINLHWN